MPKASKRVMTDARAIVRTRDGHRCQMCGASVLNIPSSIHHRINKGSGGSALYDRPSLLIRLCGTGTTGCHGWVTEHPRLAGTTGWLLPRNNPNIDPTQEPILTINGWLLLDDLGDHTSTAAPLEAV